MNKKYQTKITNTSFSEIFHVEHLIKLLFSETILGGTYINLHIGKHINLTLNTMFL